jgi:erythromycin esterase-like protein
VVCTLRGRAMSDYDALQAVRHAAPSSSPTADGFPPRLDLIGNARIVLIGEATHGTDEFYRIRADLPQIYPTGV